MKNVLFASFVLLFSSLSSIAQSKIDGSGNVKSESRVVSAFSSIICEKGIDIYISQGKIQKVEVQADDNILPFVTTEVNNNTLLISHSRSFMHTKTLKVLVTVSDLTKLIASGGSDVFSTGELNFSNFTCDASGGSDIKLQLNTKDLNLVLSGGSDAKISGKAVNFEANAEGGSDLKADDLLTDFCKITAHGGSDVHINASKELDIVSTGGSDVYYSGDAKVIRKQASGGSDIHRR